MTTVDPAAGPAGAVPPFDPEHPPWTVRPPSRFKRFVPAASGIALVAATAYTAAVDPNTSHAFPLCPLRYVTHMDCPMCGGLRSVHSLAHGDLVGAADHNVVFVLAVPFLVVGYLLWLGRSLGLDLPVPRLSPRVVGAVVVFLALFAVARNLPIPGHDFLNSTSHLAGRAS